jgi:hypothetical protein
MKTTLNVDATVMAKLKREAARQGRTMSELVETALRLLLQSSRRRETLPTLPSFRSGGALVDIADREALYQAMAIRYARDVTAPSADRLADLRTDKRESSTDSPGV